MDNVDIMDNVDTMDNVDNVDIMDNPTDGVDTLGFQTTDFAPRLLAWFAEKGRDLPWRVKGGPHPDPYIVWISEIMLQQTTVATVIPYFRRFVERFPDLPTLASASVDDVLTLWQGLGYYRRAHQLHACAQVLTANHGGNFPRPSQPEELLKLPGIGPYTAASISALAFDLPAAVVDGNVMRILSRLFCIGIDTPLSGAKASIAALARELLPTSDIADYTSAIMDLGATVCRPQKPECPLCPWQEGCGAFGKNECDRYPVIRRREKRSCTGYVFWLEDERGCVLVRRREQGALLRGLREFPWTDDVEGAESEEMLAWPVSWERTEHTVRHTFTHFHLSLRILRGCVDSEEFAPFGETCAALADSGFVLQKDFSQLPFSRLMGKVIDKMTRNNVYDS
jgi:A/G-specific adenine glycosylase